MCLVVPRQAFNEPPLSSVCARSRFSFAFATSSVLLQPSTWAIYLPPPTTDLTLAPLQLSVLLCIRVMFHLFLIPSLSRGDSQNSGVSGLSLIRLSVGFFLQLSASCSQSLSVPQPMPALRDLRLLPTYCVPKPLQ